MIPQKPPMETQRLDIRADLQQLDAVRTFVAKTCAAWHLGARDTASMRLAVDETCTNIVRHAYAGREGNIQIEIGVKRGWLEVRILDQGEPFDGRVEVAHLGRYIDAKRKGGLGMFLVHKLVDEVLYRTTPAGNEWLLRKRLPRGASGLAPTLRRRYALRATGSLAGAALLIVAPLWVHEGRHRAHTEQRALVALAQGLAEAARPVLVARTELSPEQTRLFEAVHAAVTREPRLLTVHIVDTQGTIWAADRQEATFGEFLEPQALGSAGQDGLRRGFETLEGFPVLHVSVPVTLAGTERLGEVHATLQWSQVRDAIRNARLRLLLTTGALVAIACLALAAWLGTLFRPMQRLVDAVHAGGANGESLPTDMPDEIGDVAKAFNEVQARFRAAQASLAGNERLNAEMQVAREIQASILLTAPPEIPGFEIARAYQPAGEVSGDYYDFLALAPEMHGIVLADVAGKGVPAALVTAMLRTALRLEARDSIQAAPVLARLHTLLAPDLRKGMFVTMLYAVLDAKHQTVSYASAGHTPMLLYRAATRETFILAPRGLPVGIALDASQSFAGSLDVERVRLHPGDALLMYTDGVTEATNSDGEAFGEERLAALVQEAGSAPASELVDRVLTEVAAFRGAAPPSDDVTVVVLRERLDAPAAESLHETIRARVAQEGESVEDACRALGVSPSTYHRLASEPADATTALLSVEKRSRLRDLIAAHPEMGVLQLAASFADAAWGGMALEPEHMHAELRRLDLHTPARRAAFAAEGRRTVPAHAPSAESEAATLGCDTGTLRAHCTTAASDGRTGIVKLAGTVDSHSCSALEPFLQRASAAHTWLVVDLCDVAYISSRGWGLLAALQSQVASRGGSIAVCGMSRALGDVHRMLGFERVLAAHADVDQAIAALVSLATDSMAAAPAVTSLPVPPVANLANGGLKLRPVRPEGFPDVVVIAVAGVVDTLHAYELERSLGDLVAQGFRQVIVDLSDVDFVSSAGWGSFTSHLPALRDRDGGVRLFGMKREVARIHALLNLQIVLPAYEELASALPEATSDEEPVVLPVYDEFALALPETTSDGEPVVLPAYDELASALPEATSDGEPVLLPAYDELASALPEATSDGEPVLLPVYDELALVLPEATSDGEPVVLPAYDEFAAVLAETTSDEESVVLPAYDELASALPEATSDEEPVVLPAYDELSAALSSALPEATSDEEPVVLPAYDELAAALSAVLPETTSDAEPVVLPAYDELAAALSAVLPETTSDAEPEVLPEHDELAAALPHPTSDAEPVVLPAYDELAAALAAALRETASDGERVVLPAYDVLVAALAAALRETTRGGEPEVSVLVHVLGSDLDLERDAELRRSGWEAYVALLDNPSSEEAA